MEILSLCLQDADPENPSIFNQIFGVQQEQQRENLDLIVKRGIFTEITMRDSIKTDSFSFRCPKLPHDTNARIGVWRNPKNPDRIEMIFGFNAIIDTSIEPELELLVACTVIVGNVEEGRHFIMNKNQILYHHGKVSKIHLADAKYDEIRNYEFSRSQGAIPIIDYNPRSENLSPQALKIRVTISKANLTPPVASSPVPMASIKNVKEPRSPAGVITLAQAIRRSDNTPRTASTGSTTTDSLTICRSTTSPS